MDKNYYLVNRENNVIHGYFRTDLEKTSPFPKGQTTFAGDFYLPETANLDLTLESLQKMRITPSDLDNFKWDEYYTETGFGSIQHKLVHVGKVNVVSYKDARLFDFSDNFINPFHNFTPNQLVELMAFVATMFQQEIGEKEYAKWNKNRDIGDKYGVYELVMKHFTIESDNSDLIHNSPEIVSSGMDDE